LRHPCPHFVKTTRICAVKRISEGVIGESIKKFSSDEGDSREEKKKRVKWGKNGIKRIKNFL
jgi:hypothetical protein